MDSDDRRKRNWSGRRAAGRTKPAKGRLSTTARAPPGAPFPFWGKEKGTPAYPAPLTIRAAELWLRHLLAPQPRRCDIGAFADRAQLEPHRRLDHPLPI